MKALFIIPEVEFLGIEVLSAHLKKHNIETKLIFDPVLFDDMFLRVPTLAKRFDYGKTIIRKLEEYKPDVVLFSLVSDIMPWFRKRAQQIRSISKVPIIVGGIHATSVPELLIELPYVDYVIAGEGDETLPRLIECIKYEKMPIDIRGVYFKINGEAKGSVNNALIQDLSSHPMPDKGLYYDAAPWSTKEYNIITSRGCPNRCTFCHNNLEARIWDKQGSFVRHRSVDNVIEELIQSKLKYKFTTMRFWDDNLLALRNFSHDLLEEYTAKVRVPFRICVHPNTITKETAKLLAKAGCWEVEMGIQTTDSNGRRICGRNENNQMIRDAVHYLKDVGVRTLADCITYLPGDSPRNVYVTAHDIVDIKPYRVIAYSLRYYPRTDIIQTALEKGVLSQKDIDNIEHGYYDGSMKLTSHDKKKDKMLHRLAGILMMSPHLSKSALQSMEDYHMEKWMPDISEIIQFLNQARSIFDKHHDVARSFRKRYFYYLTH
ncbi:MAG: B12-binding domain-containing radical SAM protein [Lachnospiraceae bacterium]|nr:B12-binding domain-containing radical SAM protein [Lachnospiraceae bacterium]